MAEVVVKERRIWSGKETMRLNKCNVNMYRISVIIIIVLCMRVQ